MERTRRAKAEIVVCWRQGKKVIGSLHMMPHHFVFRYQFPQSEEQNTPAPNAKTKETWIGFPMISSCVYRPSPPASHLPPSIRLRCRDFTFFSFHFEDDLTAREIFETIKHSACKLGHVNKLLAYSYSSNAEKAINGWELYDPKKEFARMGISEKSKDKGWRISTVNAKFEYSPTYPAVLVVPSNISDNTLKHTANFRSKARVPVLSYIHALNNCTITRSAQPGVGIRQTRSPQDEKLVNAIFDSTQPRGRSNSGVSTPKENDSSANLGVSADSVMASVEKLDVGGAVSIHPGKPIDIETVPSAKEAAGIAKVYGAQQRNVIVDARPNINAMAQQAMGYGSENMEGYPSARKMFLGIENIHVMRKSLDEVIEALKDSDLTTLPPITSSLERSKWKKHIGLLLTGANIIANTIAVQHSHVLIHCSDGWDRTSQLSALSQLCLDPYYRTIEGFCVLVEKDWLSFGHMFRLRSGLLSHDKWFEVENERIITNRPNNGNDAEQGDVPGNAFENALAKAQGFFRRRPEGSDGLVDPDLDSTLEGSPARTSTSKHDKMDTKPKEMSPIFHQFLDAVYQLLRQYPTKFEYNERFLRRLFYHLYSCQYGTFMFNNEKERIDNHAKEKTYSVWGYFLSKKQQFINEQYDSSIDEKVIEKASLIKPDPQTIAWWHELFGRTEAEMKGAPLYNSAYHSDPLSRQETLDSSSTSEAQTTESGSGVGSVFGNATLSGFALGRTDPIHRFARFGEQAAEPVAVERTTVGEQVEEVTEPAKTKTKTESSDGSYVSEHQDAIPTAIVTKESAILPEEESNHTETTTFSPLVETLPAKDVNETHTLEWHNELSGRKTMDPLGVMEME